MNVLFTSIAWPRQGESNLYSDLMDEFVLHGHQVFVASATDQISQEVALSKTDNDITVLKIRAGKIRKTSRIRKAISLLTLGWKILKAIKGHLAEEKIDLIIGHTPPVTFSLLFRKLKRRYNAPFYLLLKDIWPQGQVDNNIFRKYSFQWLYLRFHEINIYKAADKIGCMSPMGVSYLLSKNNFQKTAKVEVCPNSIKPNNEFEKVDHVRIRKKFGIPENACVFIFSGNLGKGHGLDFLVKAIKKMSTYPKAFFLIGGSGTHFSYIENAFAKYSGRNVFLYSWLSIKDFESVMQTSDVGLILLDKCYTVPQFPSRLLSYLNFSKPVLCAVNQGTDIGKMVEEEGCGRTILHGDIEAFQKAVKMFCEKKEERLKMGSRSRQLLIDKFQVSHSYNAIMKNFDLE